MNTACHMENWIEKLHAIIIYCRLNDNGQTWLVWKGLLHCQMDSLCQGLGVPEVEDDGKFPSVENVEGKVSTFPERSSQLHKLWSVVSLKFLGLWENDEDKSFWSWSQIKDKMSFFSFSGSFLKSRICRIMKQDDWFCWQSYDVWKKEEKQTQEQSFYLSV